VVTGGDDRRIRMWDPAHIGAGPTEVGRHDGGVLSAVTLPGGKVVTSGDDRHIRIWNAATSLELARVSRSAVALAVGPPRKHGDWQLVMIHEGGEISGWSIQAAALYS
jgi:WD40 repeat protein